MAAKRYLTRDHDTIRRWAEERDGTPSTVASTHTDDDAGIIRLDFPGYSGEGSLEAISWDEWFEKFDESGLVLLFQEETSDGQKSNFNKLIQADTAEEAADTANTEWIGGDGRSRSTSRFGNGAERVNLNKATAEELDGVFGIGPATARRIVEYRDQELGGEFHSPHDITHIDGLGEKTAELITRNSTL